MGSLERKQLLMFVMIVGLCLASWGSSWFSVSGRGVYTEGLEREPTIVVEYRIDSSRETVTVSLYNATPLLSYWSQREDIGSGGDSATNPAEPTEAEHDSGPCDDSCLDTVRSYTALSMISTLTFCFLGLSRCGRGWGAAAYATWFAASLLLLFAVPIAAAADFGMSNSDSPTGGFDSNTQDSVTVDQFAHFNSEDDSGISLSGFLFEYDSYGYDLGLLDEENRQSVIEQAPQKGEPGYESLIRFHGELSIGPDGALWWWLLVAPLLFAAPRGSGQPLEEE